MRNQHHGERASTRIAWLRVDVVHDPSNVRFKCLARFFRTITSDIDG